MRLVGETTHNNLQYFLSEWIINKLNLIWKLNSKSQPKLNFASETSSSSLSAKFSLGLFDIFSYKPDKMLNVIMQKYH